MKIVCDACQAKYSIGDDKVQGKVFKIRCKKCSNIIVVRGNAAAEPAPAPQEKDTRVYDYGYDGGGGGAAAPAADDAVWHLVINQDQVGPMSVGEVQQRFSAGEIDGETFAWREGFADWLPLAQVDAFASFVAGGGGGGAAPAHDAGGAAAMFGGDDGGGAPAHNDDLFAAASSSRGRSHADDGGGDLFGSSKPAAAASSAAAGSKLRGERNENSVLFSLNNLAQLASDKPAPVAAAAPGHATGAAGGEGSGLIDIRSMASAYMGSGGGGAAIGKPATASSIGSIDDLPVFGGGGFSEPAVIVPVANRGRDNKLLYLMIGAVALLAVVAVIMVVILMKGGNNKSTNPQVAANDTKTDTADKAKDTDKPAADKDSGSGSAEAPAAAAPTAAAPAPTAAAPAPAPTAAAAEPAAPAHEPAHEAHASSHHGGGAAPSHTAKAEPTPPPAPKDPAGGGNCDEVSCLVGNGGACCARYAHKGGGGGGAANSNLPDALDRDMIQSAVNGVHGRVAACGSKFPGVSGKVKIHVRVGGDGHVSNASVETSPDPGLGSCVQSALSRASFPKTQNGGSFGYPFIFPM